MGDLIQMDGLSRGAKPKSNSINKVAKGAPGGQVFDEKNKNSPSNVVDFPGGAKQDEKNPGPIGKKESPAGSASQNATPPAPSKEDERLNKFKNRIGGAAQNAKPAKQKALQKKLNQLQKAAPELSKKLSGGTYKAIASLAMDVAKQIHPTKDWFFLFILFPAALLKDLFDFVFTAVPPVGVVISFIGSILILLLTVIALLLAGSDIKNRGLAKYLVTLLVGFVADSIPGLDAFPITFLEVTVAYGLTIFDRAMDYYAQKSEGKDSSQSESSAPETQIAAADDYAKGKAA